jgi:hypothetical protein
VKPTGSDQSEGEANVIRERSDQFKEEGDGLREGIVTSLRVALTEEGLVTVSDERKGGKRPWGRLE